MANPIYTALSRQTGLWQEMQVVANNVANMSTAGYRREDVVFSEYLRALGPGEDAMAQTRIGARIVDLAQGNLAQTGSAFDLAIEGDGFFQVETPGGVRLTRAGSFHLGADGALQTADGYAVLDEAGAPVVLPGAGGELVVGQDGTISADGQPIGRIGVVVAERLTLSRESALLFATDGAIEPVLDARVLQGFVEQSNVNPVHEISRLIEVQRSYELSSQFVSQEDDRMSRAVRVLGQSR